MRIFGFVDAQIAAEAKPGYKELETRNIEY